jgi:hypothetical protein
MRSGLSSWLLGLLLGRVSRRMVDLCYGIPIDLQLSVDFCEFVSSMYT